MESAIAIESAGFANMTSSGSACAGDDWNGEDGGGGGLWGLMGVKIEVMMGREELEV